MINDKCQKNNIELIEAWDNVNGVNRWHGDGGDECHFVAVSVWWMQLNDDDDKEQ